MFAGARKLRREFDLKMDCVGFTRLSAKQSSYFSSADSVYAPRCFFNRILKSFVLVDLKRGDLRHQDLGQTQMYVNYFDRVEKLPEERPTIGIVLCHDKSDALVEMTLPEENNQIFARQYRTVLPSKIQLKKLVEAQLR